MQNKRPNTSPRAALRVRFTIRVVQTHAVRATALAFLLFSLPAHSADAPANWPQFRGPGATGVADHPGLPEHWGTNENVAWKVDVAGRGWSSPIVWGNRVFVTTV